MWKKLILPFICNKTWIKEAEIVGNFLSHCFYCKNIAADFIINHVVKLRIRQNNFDWFSIFDFLIVLPVDKNKETF